MFNADMRLYNYHAFGAVDAYGQPQLLENQGEIKMAINILSQTVQDNALYKDATYIGLTHANITDAFVIQYGDKRLKTLYINPKGRFKQVFMAEV